MKDPLPDESFRDSEKACPRCGDGMEIGYLNAGKGPFRWVDRPDQHKTIFGGDHVVKQHWLWGRHVIPAARCTSCGFGLFSFDPKSPASVETPSQQTD